MALNINGTTGISGVDGSASAPAVTGTDSNTGINFASDTVNINTGGSTRATVDSAGRLLVGTTTEGNESATELVLNGSSNVGMTVRSSSSNAGSVFFSDGTSGADEYRGYVQYEHANDAMTFGTNAAERMRIQSDGDVSFSNSATGATQIKNVSGDQSSVNGGGFPQYSFVGNEGTGMRRPSANNLAFDTNGDERIRINSSGNVGIGTTIQDHLLHVKGSSAVLKIDHTSTGDTNAVVLRHARGNLSGFSGKAFSFTGNSNTEVGTIRIGLSSTSYNTSSDYRLKENAVAISDGITRLKTLKPYKFNWISDDTNTPVDGFFAHEVSSAVPEAISGTKDAVDSDNKPVHQEIDQSKLVPLLTAALQEAVAKIEVLETKVAALEAG